MRSSFSCFPSQLARRGIHTGDISSYVAQNINEDSQTIVARGEFRVKEVRDFDRFFGRYRQVVAKGSKLLWEA